jgi:hypothetical protein
MYAILIYGDEHQWESMPEAEGRKVLEQHMQYGKDLAAAGLIRGGQELQPTRAATTLRMKGGKIVTTDGPFAETKEQLGGFYLIDAPDLDQALHWAARCPSIHHGTIEVRPVVPHDMA